MRKIVPTEFFTDSSDTRPLFLAYILCLSLSLSLYELYACTCMCTCIDSSLHVKSSR